MSTTSRADTAGVLRALTRILEHADALHAEGYSSRTALGVALVVHKPNLGLALVARSAWALAVGTDVLSTALDGFDERGDRA